MTRDASLDEFLGGSEEDDSDDIADEGEAGDADEAVPEEATSEAGDAEADEVDPPLDPSAVDSAASTYAWTPEGAACAACDATVERRWRDDAGLVCADCKEW